MLTSIILIVRENYREMGFRIMDYLLNKSPINLIIFPPQKREKKSRQNDLMRLEVKAFHLIGVLFSITLKTPLLYDAFFERGNDGKRQEIGKMLIAPRGKKAG